jgi:uncharacterized protein YjiS (DUF1127 family)
MTQLILVQANYLLSPISDLIQTILRFFSKLRAIAETKSAIRETERELRKLSDYELADIGLSRGDIYYTARSKPVITDCKENVNLKGWV